MIKQQIGPAEAEIRIKLSTIKPDIRDICKKVKQSHFPSFLLKNIRSIKMLFTLISNGFIVICK